MITIRPTQAADLETINDIYNYFILNSAITFDVEPWSMEKRTAWFEQQSKDVRQNNFVAVLDNKVIGFAYNAPFNPKRAYDSSTELTVYKAIDCAEKGVGSTLYQHLIESLISHNYHRAYALITTPNEASMKLHYKLGFTDAGLMREVGEKHGKFHDVALLEKSLTKNNLVDTKPLNK